MARRPADPLIWTSTSVRIERSLLRELKIIAVEMDTTVNTLILDGIGRTLTLYRKRLARKAAREAA